MGSRKKELRPRTSVVTSTKHSWFSGIVRVRAKRMSLLLSLSVLSRHRVYSTSAGTRISAIDSFGVAKIWAGVKLKNWTRPAFGYIATC